jgi:hypothetical protein
MDIRRFQVILVLLLIVLLAACGGKTKVESDLGIKKAPDWVNEGTNILKNKGGRLFHGVGSAPAIGDESLQISTADGRARAELARILTSYMNVVSSDYVATAGKGEEQSTDQEISRQIENLTKINLSGSRVLGRWRDKKKNVIYSIVELDMKHVKETVKQVEAMNVGLRNFISERGDGVFDEMLKRGM